MRSKYAIPVELKELDEILELNKDEAIWQQTVKSKGAVFNFITQLVIAGFWLYYFRDVFNILYSLAIIFPYGIALYISSTMKYSIFPNRLEFEWGLFGKKKVAIPFKDVTAINLVKYNDSDLATIHFGTKTVYKIKKLNFNENESRPHITFENVKKGDKVFELLNLLWDREKNK